MAFRSVFEDYMEKFKGRIQSDPDVKKLLSQYNGRSLLFKVRDDTSYLFKMFLDGVKLEVSPANPPNDMYLEMGYDTAKALLVDEKRGFMMKARVTAEYARGSIKTNIPKNEILGILKMFGI